MIPKHHPGWGQARGWEKAEAFPCLYSTLQYLDCTVSSRDWWGPGTREEEQERGPERPQSRGEGEGPISLDIELVTAGTS